MLKTLLSLTAILLFSGCGQTAFIAPKMPILKQIKAITPIKLRTNSVGGLDHSNTVKAVVYMKQLKLNNSYYRTAIEKYNKFAVESNNVEKEK